MSLWSANLVCAFKQKNDKVHYLEKQVCGCNQHCYVTFSTVMCLNSAFLSLEHSGESEIRLLLSTALHSRFKTEHENM